VAITTRAYRNGPSSDDAQRKIVTGETPPPRDDLTARIERAAKSENVPVASPGRPIETVNT
jgi:hypothetical protein